MTDTTAPAPEEMSEPFPKFCNTCKWALDRDQVSLRCVNPRVNSKDAYALSSSSNYRGSSATGERTLRGWFSVCGMKGKQWTPI